MCRAVAAAALLALAACGYDVRPREMTTRGAPVAPLAGAIAVGDVTGGRELWAIYVTEVRDRDVSRALERSLAARGMLAARDPRYRFELQMADWAWPTHGDDMTVAVTVRCRVSAPNDARAYWEAQRPATFTAPLAAAREGGARLRLAQEGAVRAGLAECLDDLAATAGASPARFAPGAPPPEPAAEPPPRPPAG